MAYEKGNGSMTSGKGMCSTKTNPLPMANQVSPKCGPGLNSDQQKANALLQKAHAEKDALRGKSGM